MRVTEIIERKRDGHELTTAEIEFFIQGYARDEIPDYQAAAWLMAVYLRGMSRRETVDLTMAMARSGDILNLKDVLPISVDKHSSGGVGDKTSLVVLPMVAACGVPVAKMSGRGLGFTGGTLDKLESISGYRVALSIAEFKEIVRKHGIVLCGQSSNLAPADGKLYALRDVTATVNSLPLIASSIMSKKIAAGADAIVLDVKVGFGAFMTDIEQAKQLALLMVQIGASVGKRTIAMLSDMNQPLGAAVGNALEVKEAIACLQDGGPRDLREHCLAIAAQMLRLARHPEGDEPEYALAEYMAEAAETLRDGSAFAKFRELVIAQGGDVRQVDDPSLLPQAQLVESIPAPRSGYVEQLNALDVAMAAVELGAGRERKGDPIDHAVGVLVHKKVGEYVTAGEPLFTLHANDSARLARAKARLARTVVYSSTPTLPLPTFYDVVTDAERRS
ncbi:MAG: thymidine phosphorylase [Candidatus Thermofonsia Clade 1 bacterium]|uniref:Thymidine phosphorylase n=1 Tax=Candidatus Thermofonsia Clade 1 bacterium TaxID=2364210 RepID=A0A2M8PZJ1_9CHLR|nr:MAG: thymidine phosphorylase [Candidatus Thermofonsia Clade 1 bacterium]